MQDLTWDEVLYRAALDHASYLIKEKKLSHFQTVKGKKNPSDRVKIHGGLIYTIVGENIVEVPLGVYLSVKGMKKSTLTYQASSSTMALVWKFSPPHYKNIISKVYNCAALACVYDSVNQRLIGVQVFGFTSIPSTQVNLPDYSKNLLQSPDKKLPYGLRAYKYKAKNQKARADFLSKAHIERGYLICPYKTAKKIFKGRRSGISQEFIPLSQFDSISKEFSSVPNRRNGLYELNGEISQPVYRRKLLKFSRKNSIREYYIDTWFLRIKKPVMDFIYPLKDTEQDTTFNLFLIKSKRLEVLKPHFIIPGGLFDMDFPELQFINSFKSAKKEIKYRLYHEYDTLQFKFFYAPGEISIGQEEQESITKAFRNKPGKIISVEASAFASIEGDKLSNDKLAKDRMGFLMKQIKPYMDSILVPPSIKTREQLVLFYKQIEGTSYQHLKKMKLEALRIYVNQHKDDSLLSQLLDAQRYIIIRIIWRDDFKELIPVKSTFEVYDSLKSLIDKTEKPDYKIINRLEQLQLNLYDEIAQKDSVQKLPLSIPYLERYPSFEYHDLIFKYTVLKSISDKNFYREIHRLSDLKYFPSSLRSQMIYNNLVLIYNNYIQSNLYQLMSPYSMNSYIYRQSEFHLKKIKRIKIRKNEKPNCYPDSYFVLKEIPAFITRGGAVKDFPSEDLWKYYYLYTIHSLYPFIPIRREIYKLLPEIKKHFHPNDSLLSDEERLKYAYFYNSFYQYSISKKLLEPIATRAEPNKEALKVYLSLIYSDYKNVREFTDRLILEYPRLGKEEWCDIWFKGSPMTILLLEDLKLKNFYNCHCER